MNDVCMLTASSTPNQTRSTPSFSATGPISGMTMNDSSKKSRKNASTKIRMLTTIRKPELPARQRGQQVLDPDVTVHAVERQAENARADQDEHDEGGKLGRRVHRLLQQGKRQPLAREGHDQRAGGTHRAALGRRGHAQEDRTQHEEDQTRAGESARRSRARQFSTAAQAQQLVDDGGEERDADPDRHRDDDPLVGRDIRVVLVVVDEPEG